jgi:hypothetical protein
MRKAARIRSGSASTEGTRKASFEQVLKKANWSKPWLAMPFSFSDSQSSGNSPMMPIIGIEAFSASRKPAGKRLAPGPTVTSQTPGRPVSRA